MVSDVWPVSVEVDPVSVMVPVEVPQPGGAVRASARFGVESFGSSRLTFGLSREQEEVQRAANGGPGWVGYSIEIAAMLAAQCDVVPLVRVGGRWERSFDPGLQSVAWQVQHPTRGQEYLVYRSMRMWAGIAELGMWPVDMADGQVRFMVAHPHQLAWTSQRPDRFGVCLRKGAKRGSASYVEYPAHRLRRLVSGGDEYPDEAFTEYERVLPEIRASRAAMQNIQGGLESRVLVNGLLWIETKAGSASDLSDTEVATYDAPYGPSGGLGQVTPTAPGSPAGGSATKLAHDLVRFAHRGFSSSGSSDPAARCFYPVLHHSAPKPIEMGRPVDRETLEVLEHNVRAGAQGIRTPIEFLTAGEGAQKYWSSKELRTALHEHAVFPPLSRLLDEWTECAYRPLLQSTPAGLRALGSTAPEDHRLGFDASSLVMPSGDYRQMLDNFRALGIRRERVAEQVGYDPETDLIPLEGSGIDDLEFWAMSTSRVADVEAVADRRTIEGGRTEPTIRDAPQTQGTPRAVRSDASTAHDVWSDLAGR